MTTGQKVGIGIGVLAFVGVGAYLLLKPSTAAAGNRPGGVGGGGVMCKDGTPGNQTAQPCLGHGGIATGQQPSAMDQVKAALAKLLNPKKQSGGGGGGKTSGSGGSGVKAGGVKAGGVKDEASQEYPDETYNGNYAGDYQTYDPNYSGDYSISYNGNYTGDYQIYDPNYTGDYSTSYDGNYTGDYSSSSSYSGDYS
jgi:hypothetical protein